MDDEERGQMSSIPHYSSSRLFLVRVLVDETSGCKGQRKAERSGRVQHVVTGEAHDFRGWAELLQYLDTLLDDPPNACSDNGSNE